MVNTIAGILAHPDDESFMASVTCYNAVQQGARVVNLYATPGDAGKTGLLGEMTKEQLAKVRKVELKRACDILGISEIIHLDYPDGQLNTIPLDRLTEQVAQFINERGAQIVFTFPEDGISGHKDHTAIHLATKNAIRSGLCPTVQKLYYANSPVQQAEGLLPSFRVDTFEHWEVKRQALLAHESQWFAVQRVFGDVKDPAHRPANHQFESFVLAWERGVDYPKKQEAFMIGG